MPDEAFVSVWWVLSKWFRIWKCFKQTSLMNNKEKKRKMFCVVDLEGMFWFSLYNGHPSRLAVQLSVCFRVYTVSYVTMTSMDSARRRLRGGYMSGVQCHGGYMAFQWVNHICYTVFSEGTRCYDCHYDQRGLSQKEDGQWVSVGYGGFHRCALRNEEDSDFVNKYSCNKGKCFIRRDSNGRMYKYT